MGETFSKGRGAQFNPDNPFSTTSVGRIHQEGIDLPEDDRQVTRVVFETPHRILSKNDSPDIPFTFSINPYQGCEHGCVYCYARNTHAYWGYSAGIDWESRITAKAMAHLKLEEVFLSKSWNPQTVMLSGNTDPYQPVERKLEITRKILGVFLKYRNPVSIITKNALILRDIDILEALAQYRLVRVTFSITTKQEQLRRILEPRTASANKMLEAMLRLSEKKIPVGVMFAPVIPSLNDEEMDDILRSASQSGASYAGYTMARFNGQIGVLFRDWLQRHFPERADKVWNKVNHIHGGSVYDSRWGKRMVGDGVYAEMFGRLFERSNARYFGKSVHPPLNSSDFLKGGNYNLFGQS
jgi:DNA repair photolyase